jgi:hypothetical protein
MLGHNPRSGRVVQGDATLREDERREVMNSAFKQACARLRLTGATPVIELVAVRILELARAGEFNPDRLTEATVATFER